MNSYQQELMEKVTDLQEQTRFCLNNYGYHHRNNEIQILQEKRKMLRSGATVFSEILQNLDDLHSTLAKVTKRCDKVENLLEKYGVVQTNETARDCGSGDRQEQEDSDSVSINNKENSFFI